MKKMLWLLLALSLTPELLACIGCSFPAPWGYRFNCTRLPYVWGYFAILTATPVVLYFCGIRVKKVSQPSRGRAHCTAILLIITELLSFGQSTLGGMVSGWLFFIPNLVILFWLALLEVWGLLLGIVIVYLLFYWIAKNLGCYHIVRRCKSSELPPEDPSVDQ